MKDLVLMLGAVMGKPASDATVIARLKGEGRESQNNTYEGRCIAC